MIQFCMANISPRRFACMMLKINAVICEIITVYALILINRQKRYWSKLWSRYPLANVVSQTWNGKFVIV